MGTYRIGFDYNQLPISDSIIGKMDFSDYYDVTKRHSLPKELKVIHSIFNGTILPPTAPFKLFDACSLNGVTLVNGEIANCTFTNVIFTDARITDTVFVSCIFKNCIFNNCEITGSTIIECTIVHCTFDGGSMDDTQLSEAHINCISSTSSVNDLSIVDSSLNRLTVTLDGDKRIMICNSDIMRSFFKGKIENLSLVSSKIVCSDYTELKINYTPDDAMDFAPGIINCSYNQCEPRKEKKK